MDNYTLGNNAVKRTFYTFRRGSGAPQYPTFGFSPYQNDSAKAVQFPSVATALAGLVEMQREYERKTRGLCTPCGGDQLALIRVEETTVPGTQALVYLQPNDKAPEGAVIKWTAINPYSAGVRSGGDSVSFVDATGNTTTGGMKTALLRSSEQEAAQDATRFNARWPDAPRGLVRRIAVVSTEPQIKRTETVLA